MSGDFKIYGRGAGFGAGGGTGGGLERFKRGRHAGDLVRGVYLRLEPASPGTAWVNLEGEELLARLPEDLADLSRRILASRGVGAAPGGPDERDFPLRPGDACFFVLEALEPDPALRMLPYALPQDQQAGGELAALLLEERRKALWRRIMSLPLAQVAARYVEERRGLDALLRERLWPEAGLVDAVLLQGLFAQLALRRFDFETALDGMREAFPGLSEYERFTAANEEAGGAGSRLLLYASGLKRCFGGRGLAGVYYLPWLYPGVSGLELALLRLAPEGATGGEEPVRAAVLLCRQPDGGSVDLRLSPGFSKPRLKIWPRPGRDLPDILLEMMPGAGIDAGGGFSRRA